MTPNPPPESASRIVILSAFLSPLRSGAEACAEEVPVLLRDQYEFQIITAKMRKDLPREDKIAGCIPVKRIGFGCTADKWLFPFLAPWAARRYKPDIIHAVLESFAGLALVFCSVICPTAKRVLTCQTTNRKFLGRLIHQFPHTITVISRVLQDRAKRFGREAELIPNGINRSMIKEARFKTEKIPGRIVFVGRLEKMKGVDILLKAFAMIAQRGQVPSHPPAHQGDQTPTLSIVGDGSERASLETQAHALGIADRVTFHGWLPIPINYAAFAESEIFCGLSRSEAFGNVFIEAQAAGCAVIGTQVDGIPDIVTDGRTGLLVPPENIDAAAEALRKLLSNDALRSQLSANGLEHAVGYDWERIAEQYGSVYRLQ